MNDKHLDQALLLLHQLRHYQLNVMNDKHLDQDRYKIKKAVLYDVLLEARYQQVEVVFECKLLLLQLKTNNKVMG